MNKKQSPIKSKLFQLKEWLTVPEAARHLLIIFDEEVIEADVLRLVLDGHLKLSVNLLTNVEVRIGKVVPCEDVGSHKIGEDIYLKFDDKVTRIRGVWDLPMIGNERHLIEYDYQRLIDGQEIDIPSTGSYFVEGQYGEICELQCSFVVEGMIGYISFPFGPDKSSYLVRGSALIDLHERFSIEKTVKEKPIGEREKTTYLNIIGALLEVIKGESPDISKRPDFSSEAKLIEHFAAFDIPGLSKSTLESKFAQAKRSLTSYQ